MEDTKTHIYTYSYVSSNVAVCWLKLENVLESATIAILSKYLIATSFKRISLKNL